MLLATGPVEGGAAAKTNRKLYYGWVIALVAAAAMLAGGNFQYAFGVFVRPLIDTFGWSRAAIAGSVSLRNIVSAISSPLVGALSDRLGARKFIVTGILLVGLSYLLASRVSSLWQLYLCLGVLTGLGIVMATVPTIATVTRWFSGRSNAGLASGVVYSGFGLAQVILPPVATLVILRYGWSTCFVGLAALAFLGAIFAWRYIHPPPPETKVYSPAVSKVESSYSGASVKRTGRLHPAFRTWTLWNLVIVYWILAICFQIITIHIIAAAIDMGVSAGAAAVILTLCGVTNTVGRLVISGLASRIGNKKIIVISFGVQAVLLYFLAGAKDLYMFYLLIGIYGLFYGGIPPMMPTLAGEYFGVESIGAIYGVMNLAYTFGAAIGPLFAGFVFDITGRYYFAFLVAAIAMTLAFVLTLVLKPPPKHGLT